MRLPIRGGNWNNGGNAGLAALNVNNARSNRNANIGCRPALEVRPKSRRYGSASSAPSKGPLILGQAPKHQQASWASSASRERPAAPPILMPRHG